MTPEEFQNLQVGEQVRNTGSGNVYTVIHYVGMSKFILAKIIDATNPAEWEKVAPSKFKEHKFTVNYCDKKETYFTSHTTRSGCLCGLTSCGTPVLTHLPYNKAQAVVRTLNNE